MTTVTPEVIVRRAPMPFGFCQSGHHDICPGRIEAPVAVRVMKGGTLVKQMKPGQHECSCPTCLCSKIPHCLRCKTKDEGELNTTTWLCHDIHGCAVRRTARTEALPIMQTIREIERKRNMTTEATEKVKTPAKPKTGNCLCCGGETKGGKFLPGHDARYVSEQVAFVMQGSKTADQARENLKDTSDALKAKFEKSLGLAKEKAEKKAAADKEKTEADAKAEVGAEEVAKADAKAAKAGKDK